MRTAPALSLLAALALAGCAVPLHQPAPTEAPVYRHASLEQLLERISSGIGGLSTLKAGFSAVITEAPDGKKQSCGGILAIARPDKLRMRGSKAMLPTLFDLLCDGRQVTLYVPREKAAYRGSYRNAAAKAPLPDLAIFSEIFFGENEREGLVHFMEAGGPRYCVYSIAHAGSRGELLRKVTFDRADLNPIRYRYFDARGKCARDIRCGDFAVVAGGEIAVPMKIIVAAPEAGSTISIRLKDVRANSRLNPALFRFELPPDASLRPLEEYVQ